MLLKIDFKTVNIVLSETDIICRSHNLIPRDEESVKRSFNLIILNVHEQESSSGLKTKIVLKGRKKERKNNQEPITWKTLSIVILNKMLPVFDAMHVNFS